MIIKNDQSINNIYQPRQNRELGAARERMQAMDEVTAKSMDNALWAAAQGLALAKLKVFHSMAKAVNDQQ